MRVKLSDSVFIRTYEFILWLSGWVSSESMFFKKSLNLQDEHHGCSGLFVWTNISKMFCKPRKSLIFYSPFTLIFRTLLANNHSCFEIYASVATNPTESSMFCSKSLILTARVLSLCHVAPSSASPRRGLITYFSLCSFQVVTPCCQVSIRLFHLELVFGPVSHKENESYTFRMQSPYGS